MSFNLHCKFHWPLYAVLLIIIIYHIFVLRVRVHVRAGEYLQVHVQLSYKNTVE